MNGDSGFTKQCVIDYGILHTVSCKFEQDFGKFKQNIKNNFSAVDINGKSEIEKSYIKSRYRINGTLSLCYYKDSIDKGNEEDLARKIFLYRNKAFADKISEKAILISGPLISFNTTNFCKFPSSCEKWEKGVFNASTFFLVSESIFTIVALIKPVKRYESSGGNDAYSEISEIICRLQKPQDVEVKIEKINEKWKKDIKGNHGDLLNEGKVYFLSKIFAILYGLSIILSWNESDLREESIEESLQKALNVHKDNISNTLDIFDTTLFTTAILFCNQDTFSDKDFHNKMPNLLYGYNKMDAAHLCNKKDFINKKDLSKDCNSMFFMTYNRFLMVFRKNPSENVDDEEFNRWVSVGFVLNEVVSGVFYSLHYFSEESTKLIKGLSTFFSFESLKKSNNLLKMVTEYSNSFFDPNIIQSQLIRFLFDEIFKINKFYSLSRAIKANITTAETVKLHRNVFWFTVVIAFLTGILIILSLTKKV